MSLLPSISRGKSPRPLASEAPPRSELSLTASVNGLLETDGDIHILGTVHGRINAGSVTIAAGGVVEGDIVAKYVSVAGRVTGRIFAINVSVESTAYIDGRVFHNTIAVERGARIDGRTPWRPPSYLENLDELPETRA